MAQGSSPSRGAETYVLRCEHYQGEYPANRETKPECVAINRPNTLQQKEHSSLFQNSTMVSFNETDDAANFCHAMDEAVRLSDGGPIHVQRTEQEDYTVYEITYQGVIRVTCHKN